MVINTMLFAPHPPALVLACAADMVHGAYGISDGDLVMTATLRLENLDFNEFSGTLDDFSVALSNHFPQLRAFVADAA